MKDLIVLKADLYQFIRVHQDMTAKKLSEHIKSSFKDEKPEDLEQALKELLEVIG